MLLEAAYPARFDLQRLVYFDYFTVHSDDLPNGPPGLHPKTPYRSGEILVRRRLLHDGLLLFASRGLVEVLYNVDGIAYSATEESGGFLASLTSPYVVELRRCARWVVETFAGETREALEQIVRSHIGTWGAEFELASVLWAENDHA